MVDLTVENVFPDGPSSAPAQPNKATIRRYFKQFETAVDAGLSNGGLIYDTKANMDADLAHDANASAWVIADGTVANNGIYRKSGASGSGSWTRIGDLPYSFIKASNAGAGTANAVQATTSVPIPAADGAALITLNITANNTGAATVSFNGGTALTIKTASGADVQADYLVAGAVVSGFVVGSKFQLTSEVGTEAAAAAAQAAADAAVAAAGSVAVKYAADDAALQASTDASDKVMFNLANRGWWLPVSDDISAEITAADPRYQPTLDDATGAGGGFVQAGSVGKGNPWVNVAGGADIIRLADRLMVGCDAVAYDGKTLGATDDTKSWLLDTHMDYLLANAAFAAVTSNYTDGSTRSSGSIAMTGAARHNGAAAGGAIGGAFAAWNDGSSTSARAWGAYAEGVRAVAGVGFTKAGEFEATGLAASPLGTAGSTPYSLTAGELHGLWVSSGGGDTADTLYNADAAIGVYNGANLFSAGIVFYDTALYRDGGTSTGRGHAIRMARNHAIEQYAGAGVLGASLAFDVSDATHRQELRISDTGMTLYNAAGNFMFRSVWSTASTVGIDLVTGTTAAIIRPNGSVADAGIIIRPGGSANGFLQSGAGDSQFRWSGSGFAFGGNTPVARPDWTAATGTASRATFDTASVTLPDLAQRVKAMIDDNLSNGLYQ